MTEPTKPTPEHFPLPPIPWTTGNRYTDFGNGRILTPIIDSYDRSFMCVNTQFPDSDSWLAQIVSAVNAHAGLVEALRDLVNQMEECNMVTREEEPLIERAKAALRAAGAEL